MAQPDSIKARLVEALWRPDPTRMPFWKFVPVGLARLLFVMIRDLLDGQITLRAMSLVYTSLLSMVPLLAISFAVLKAFGVHNQIEGLLVGFLAPLGEKRFEITAQVIGFVENIQAGVLGAVGFALLLYTVISLMQKIERAFNYIWHVSQERPFAKRFSDYLSVILVGPVLVFSALALTASLTSVTLVERLVAMEPLGSLLAWIGRLVPYLMIIGVFAFIYVFMPNTRVRWRSALVGAAVAGTLWQTVGWAFASFIATSTKYTAVYSTFATPILFMIWLYVGWLILLVGAGVAFYHQNPAHLAPGRGDLRLSPRQQERLALMMVLLVGQAFYRGMPALTGDRLAARLQLPPEAVDSVLRGLVQGGLLAPNGDDPPAYLPARPFDETSAKAVIDCVRLLGDTRGLDIDRVVLPPAVETLLDRLDQSSGALLATHSLKDLALADDRDGRDPVPLPGGTSQPGR